MRLSRETLAVLLGCVVVCAPRSALADKLFLNDGTVMEGKITEEKEGQSITITTAKGSQTVPVKRVKKVERDPVPPAAPPKGEHVALRDGSFVEGKIVAEDAGESVTVETKQGTVKIRWENVKRVVRVQSNEELKNDRVLLKDGTTIDGTVVEERAGDYVVIRDLGGRKQTIPWGEVKRVQRVKGAATTEPGSRTIGEEGGETKQGLDAAEKRRQAFLERGGHLFGYDLQGSFLYLSFDYSGTSVTGFGFGAGGHVSYYYMSAPNPANSESTWLALRATTGVEFAGARITAGDTKLGAYLFNFPVALGGQIGLGSYRGTGEWKGVMVGLDYKPSGSVSIVQGDSSTGFNYAAFQLTADFVTLRSLKEDMSKVIREAGIRTSIFVLPPVGDLPFILYLGAGITWY